MKEKVRNGNRKNWPSLFAEEPFKLDINNWIKIFAIIWIMYLIMNTINPITKIVNNAELNLLTGGNFIDTTIILLKNILYFTILSLGVIWVAGIEGYKKLYQKFRFVDILLVFFYSILYIIFIGAGAILIEFIPNNLGIEANSILETVQYISFGKNNIVGIYELFLVATEQLSSILIFLGVYSIVLSKLAKRPKLGVVVVYLVSSIITGALMTTPVNRGLINNIIMYGIGQIPLFFAYRRTRNILIPIFVVFILNRILSLLLLYLVL